MHFQHLLSWRRPIICYFAAWSPVFIFRSPIEVFCHKSAFLWHRKNSCWVIYLIYFLSLYIYLFILLVVRGWLGNLPYTFQITLDTALAGRSNWKPCKIQCAWYMGRFSSLRICKVQKKKKPTATTTTTTTDPSKL